MNSHLHQLQLSPSLVRRIAAIDEFKGRWQALGNLAPERLTNLERIATIESVASSTRIEGVTLSDAEVDQLLSQTELRSLSTRDEQEVEGYRAAMELVFESWQELELSENHLKQVHGVMLNPSVKDERHRGEYKSTQNSIEAFDADGRSLGLVFATATPFDTPRLMTALVEETRSALACEEFHPLLVIAVFVERFLAIHPFQDGNGRLSRVLTSLLLLKSGYVYVPFASLERVIEHNKDAYYQNLRRSQTTWDTDEPKLIAWVEFFIGCIAEQKNVLLHRLERESSLTALAPLSAAIVSLAQQRGRVTLSDVVTLEGANRNTVKLHLRQLVAAGELVRHGQARGTWYEQKR